VRVLFETRDYESKMNVWVEPVEVEKDVLEDERPIAQFEVATQSFLGREEVSATKAIFSTDEPCKSPLLRLLHTLDNDI
jgi:hypothetical protein